MITWRRSITLTSLVGLFICWSLITNAQHNAAGKIEVLDARQWDFSRRMPLSHTWSFIENKIVSPEAVGGEESSIIFFPSIWNDKRADKKGLGCATYMLNVIVPDTSRSWALEIPQPYGSYKVWVNGELIASAGTVGMTSDNVTPKWVYQTASFTSAHDTLQIVLQLANFHHHKGGATHPIYLGSPDSIQSHFYWSIGSNAVEAIVLFLEGLFFLFFYRRNQKHVILYFALLCTTWAIRSIFSNLYLIVLIFPDINWQWLVKIEYMTLYLTVIWAALFFNCIFKDISNNVFTYLPIVINLFFIVFTLLTPAIIFTQWISFYLGVAAFVILYGVTMIFRALITEKEGSWFLMSSICTGVVLFAYDIAAYHSSFSYNIVLLNIGYVAIFILTTIALLYHMGIFKNHSIQKNSLTMSDLYETRKI